MSEDQLTALFGDLRVAQMLVWLFAALALLFIIVRAWPKLKAFIETIDALSDLPAKMRLVDEIHHEVRPNTGTSLNDAVRRTEAKVKQLEAQVTVQTEQIAGLQTLMEAGDSDLSDRVTSLEDTLNPAKEKP